jgi:nucleoside-diphosphate-sugar epimerase
MRKVLVTGASGFVGGHVAHALRERGIAVRCLVRQSSRRDFLAPLNPEWAIGDITDPESLLSALAGVDRVVHCAGVTKAPSRREYFRINEEGSRNLYAACARAGAIRKIVHLSSLGALGPARAASPVTEDSPPRPVSHYGESKLAGQRLAESWMRELPIAIVLPPAVYGPHDTDMLAFFKCVRRGLVPLIGRRARTLSLIYAKDLAQAIVEVLLHERTIARSYLVEDGCAQTWTSLAETIAQAMSVTPRFVRLPTVAARAMGAVGDLYAMCTGKAALINSQKIRELLQDSWTCSSRRIQEELGFRTRFSLTQGIAETVAWYREQRWL